MAVITNLVAYYPCDEASGDLLDAHGSNNLTDTNTVGTTTGKVSGARDFEYDTEEIAWHADNASFSVGDIDFALGFWIKPESFLGFRAVIGQWDWDGGDSDRAYVVYLDDDDLHWVVDSTGTFTTVADINLGTLSTGTWYYVVVWHDAVNNQVGGSINDGTPTTTSFSAGCRDSAMAFAVGGSDGGTSGLQAFSDEAMDEIAFWKKVPTSGERTWLYNSGAGRSYADIVAEAGGGGTVVPVFMNQYRQRSS